MQGVALSERRLDGNDHDTQRVYRHLTQQSRGTSRLLLVLNRGREGHSLTIVGPRDEVVQVYQRACLTREAVSAGRRIADEIDRKHRHFPSLIGELRDLKFPITAHHRLCKY